MCCIFIVPWLFEAVFEFGKTFSALWCRTLIYLDQNTFFLHTEKLAFEPPFMLQGVADMICLIETHLCTEALKPKQC